MDQPGAEALKPLRLLLVLLFLLLIPVLASAQTVVNDAVSPESFTVKTTSTTAGNAQVLLVQPDRISGLTAKNNLGQTMTLDACTGSGFGNGSGDGYNCVFYICNGSAGVTSVTISGPESNIQSIFFEISGVSSSGCAGAVSTIFGPAAPSTISVAPTQSKGIGIIGFACAGPATSVTSSAAVTNLPNPEGNPVGFTNFTGGATISVETDAGGSGCVTTDCCRTNGYSAIFATFGATGSTPVGDLGNPVPFVNQPPVPAAAAAGGPALTLTVNGTEFVPGAVVNWNGSARPTTFVNASQVTAAISASDVATAGTATIAVLNPEPGGGSSNVVFLPITTPTSTITMNRTDVALDTGAIPTSVVEGDLNNDGNPDLIVANSNLNTVSILLGNGDGTFQSSKDTTLPQAPVSVFAADLNHDGYLDLVVSNSNNSVTILLGNGDGTFQTPVSYAVAASPNFIVAADFNHDGGVDLAIVNSAGSTVSILLGNGDGTFQTAVSYPAGASPYAIAVGDFNGDGALDLAISNDASPGSVSILLGKGDGTFLAPIAYGTGNLPVSITSGDFNRDGYLDLAVSAQGSNIVSILLGNGDGTFQTHMDYASGANPEEVIAADFNGDGTLDLAVANQLDNDAAILIGNGDGTFQSGLIYPTVSSPVSIAAADFNKDGRIDLAVNGSTNAISILTQAASATLSATGLTFADQALGTQSVPQSVTLTNTGGAPVNIASIAVTGINNIDFSQTNTCGATVNGGAACTINVLFAPSDLGPLTAAVTITDNTSGGSQVISLSGNGTPGTITSANSATFVLGTAGSFTVTTSGAPTYSLTETGALPNGVTFVDNQDGTSTLSGTPGPNTAKTYSLQFTASNGVNSNATQIFTLTVNQSAAITSVANTTFAAGTAGTFTVTATGVPLPVLSETGALPTGVTFTPGTGKLAGTPAAGTAGSYGITFTAHNGVGADATQSFTLTVNQPAPPPVTFVRSAGNYGQSVRYSVAISPTAGDFLAVFVWQIEGGATPPITDNLGSAYVKDCDLTYNQGFGTGRRFTVYHLQNAPSGITTVNITPTVPSRGIVAEYSGMPLSGTVLDVCGAMNNQTSGVKSWTSTAMTTTATDLVFGLADTGGTANAGYAASGTWTGRAAQVNTPDGDDSYFEDKIGMAPGSYTATGTTTASVVESSIVLAYKAAPAQVAPTITSAGSATFAVGTPGTFTVKATGTPAATLGEAGALPAGVIFTAASGVLAGTPAAGTSGSYPITFAAQNGVAPNATQSFTLTVNQAAAITSASNAALTSGTPGTFTVTATGLPAPTLSETGALPSGVTFTAATGILSGTPAAGTGGSYPITFTAHNSAGADATQNFILTVNQDAVITSVNNATFAEGLPGTYTVTATGMPTPTLLESGALPTGVTFTAATGILAGTPAAGTSGSYPITFTAHNGIDADAMQNFTLTVTLSQAAAVTSANYATFTVGTAGTFTVTATGSPTPSLSETGTLPSGVTFSAASGILAGTPLAGTAGTYLVTFTAHNGVGADAMQSFTLTVNQAAAITSANGTTFTAGTAGTFTVTATGSPTPSVSQTGTLPTGVTFTAQTGILAGTPAAGTAGSYPITFTAHNGVGADAMQSFTLTVNQAAAFTSANYAIFLAGTSGTFTVTATGSPTPSLSETGTLPAGVTFTALTGTLGGTPAAGAGGTYPITFTAHNGVGADVMQSFTLTVNQAAAITSANAAIFSAGAAGTFTVIATGSPAPSLSETGTLPSGVTFTAQTGALAGTPAAGTTGSYPITFTAHNGVGADATQSFTMTVNLNQAAAFTSANNATFMFGLPGTFAVTATGSPVPTLSEAGTLPAGLSFVPSTGILGGTPATGTGGTYAITFTAANGVGSNAVQNFSLIISAPPAPALTSVTPSSGLRGTAVPVILTGANFTTTGTTVTAGSGVTVGAVTVVNSTTITATLTISATATLGARNISVTTSGGTSNSQTFVVLGPALVSIAPTTGARGTGVPVTISGSGLIGATAVTVSGSGVTVSGLTVVNDTTVTATFTISATAATGARSVSVTAPGGTSNTETFTVGAPAAPTLSSVTPNTGLRGTAVPVTLTGTNFTASGSTVTVSGSGVSVGSVTVVNSTTITATFTISTSATISGRNVTVTTPGGTSNAVIFTLQGPTLISISPTSGLRSTSVPVTISGSGLTGATAVTVSGSGVTVSGLTVMNDTMVTATFTIAATATTNARSVSVTAPGGTSNTETFTVSAPPAPTLSSVAPNTGLRGTAVPVTLTGTNFAATGTTVSVSGSGVSVGSITVVNSTTITATATISTSATISGRNVTVTTPGGTSNAVTFTVQGPTLASVAPNPVTHGTHVLLTLTGTNLTGASAVSVSGIGTNCTVTGSTSTTISATCSLTAGTRTVSATTPIGTTGTVSLRVN